MSSVKVLKDADSCEIEPVHMSSEGKRASATVFQSRRLLGQQDSLCVEIELFHTLKPGFSAVVSLRHKYPLSMGANWIDCEAHPCLPFCAT